MSQAMLRMYVQKEEVTTGDETLVNRDCSVRVGGSKAMVSNGATGVVEALVNIMGNPEFRGAMRGRIELVGDVEMTRDSAGNHIVRFAAIDIITFDPDESSIAQEAFQLIRSSDLVDDVAIMTTAAPTTKRRRRTASEHLTRFFSAVFPTGA